MKTEIIKIGNSKGIRIPAYILKECNIAEKIELEVKDGQIIITPVDEPRKGWGKKFECMKNNGDDKLFISEDVGLDAEDWEW
ncbi:MAG: AbrB/MazE/SpoVT family DNA-binding domain-containing protein [Firmicutes bacterium]|nr:AbrB/MazE/SpoVT family DNA-binding domain-containing protein [Bacillota bacterium]NSW93056.1 AbrB/MazE/SpoVT family DNA-binding domain-containing protein [Bacillota bacterium]